MTAEFLKQTLRYMPDPVYQAARYFFRPHEKEDKYFLVDSRSILRFGLKAPRIHELLWCRTVDIPEATRFLEWQGALPEDVQMSRRGHPDWHDGFIAGGDWDEWLTPLHGVPVIKRTFRRYREGLSWEEVGEVAYIQDSIARTGKPKDGCLTLPDIMCRLHRLDQLHAFIKAGGLLLPQKDLRRRCFREYGGIGAGVRRNGTLVWIGGGAHRLGIALEIGLEHLPICISRVHPEAILSGAYERLKLQSAVIANTLRMRRENPPWRIELE